MKTHRHLFPVLCSLVGLCAGFATTETAQAQVSASDSLALVALYDSTGGPGWTNKDNWLTGPVKDWHGIRLSEERVSDLRLGDNDLTGQIPDAVCDLTALETLNVDTNNLTGSIPECLGGITTLESLFLSSNQFTGAIPSALGNLINVEILFLHGNQLTGEIPTALVNLANVENLSLAFNQLTGEIPKELSNLTNLTALTLIGNQLTGEIPKELGNLPNLEFLTLSLNLLTGPIPTELGNLTNLESLGLNDNLLTGPIPTELGNLTNLESLGLGDNQLTGPIPTELGNLTKLEQVILFSNQLTGAVPETFANLSALESLILHENQLEDLPDLTSLGFLQKLHVQSNRFTFEGLEPNAPFVGTIQEFIYSPQDTVGTKQEVSEDGSVTFSVDVGGSVTTYQWFRDGVEIPGADESSYTISAVEAAAGSEYHCRAENPLLPGLVIAFTGLNDERYIAG